MTVAPPKILGIGLYTAAEAAMYARVSAPTMSRWLFGAGRGEPAITPQLGKSDDRFVTFLDLVQSLAIRSIRLARKISLQKIREAVDLAQDEFNIDYPLARRHTIYILKNDIVINYGDQKSKKYIEATGRNKRALLLAQIAEPFMEDVGFDPDGLASWYRAYVHKEFEVKLNPKVRFGEPMITSCGYSAQALWDAYISEGGIKAAAKSYGVKEDEIETAVRYFDHILPRAAA